MNGSRASYESSFIVFGEDHRNCSHGFKTYKKTKKQEDPPVVSRSWVDNMIMFRDKLFGKTAEQEVEAEPGEPQVKIHYPNYSEKPYVSISEARKAQAVLNQEWLLYCT